MLPLPRPRQGRASLFGFLCMEESASTCTGTPAHHRLGSFQDCWLTIRPTLQEWSPRSDSNRFIPLYKCGTRPNENLGHGADTQNQTGVAALRVRRIVTIRCRHGGPGRNRTDAIRTLQVPAFLLGYRTVVRCPRLELGIVPLRAECSSDT
jgi:hypothetical protein